MSTEQAVPVLSLRRRWSSVGGRGDSNLEGSDVFLGLSRGTFAHYCAVSVRAMPSSAEQQQDIQRGKSIVGKSCAMIGLRKAGHLDRCATSCRAIHPMTLQCRFAPQIQSRTCTSHRIHRDLHDSSLTKETTALDRARTQTNKPHTTQRPARNTKRSPKHGRLRLRHRRRGRRRHACGREAGRGRKFQQLGLHRAVQARESTLPEICRGCGGYPG